MLDHDQIAPKIPKTRTLKQTQTHLLIEIQLGVLGGDFYSSL